MRQLTGRLKKIIFSVRITLGGFSSPSHNLFGYSHWGQPSESWLIEAGD